MSRRILALLALTLAALAAAQAATAKEGANLMTFPTNGADTGTTWQAQFEAFSHDRADISPAVVIRNKSGKTLRFAAERVPGSGTAGGAAVYRADVVFPAAGVWAYGVQLRPGARPQWFDDSAVTIEPAPNAGAAEADGGFNTPVWLVPLAALLVLGGFAAYAGRRALRAWAAAALR